MRFIDLRSDTVTQPTQAMRRAMADARVGDDVFGEDPTVNRLEAMAAAHMGKEAAVFVTSGTMANLVSLLVHCGRGDEMILGHRSHTFLYEQGGSSALGGIHPRTVHNQPDGTIAFDHLEEAVRPDNIHFPRTRLIVLENTHNRCAGSPLDPAYMEGIGRLAQRYSLKVHVDGARIFNAAAALGVDASKLVEKADSVTFCLSKGLAAPVGSLVCGSQDFIAAARRARKLLGGGMRQAGILAAAGIVALNEMKDRMTEDHSNARALAEGLSRIPGLSVAPEKFRTNIVYADISPDTGLSGESLSQQLSSRGVGVLPTGPQRIRLVTHYHIMEADVEYALGVIREMMNARTTG
ncbi:MAG: low-specificity L-threonine aldolase [Desulfatiglandaceae bacterium]